jgi:hypothetical protein
LYSPLNLSSSSCPFIVVVGLKSEEEKTKTIKS